MPFLGRDFSQEPDYSEEVARAIDDEIRRIIEEAHDRARAVLAAHREQLDSVAKILVERETIERGEFEALLDGTPAAEVFREKDERARQRSQAEAEGEDEKRAPTPASAAGGTSIAGRHAFLRLRSALPQPGTRTLLAAVSRDAAGARAGRPPRAVSVTGSALAGDATRAGGHRPCAQCDCADEAEQQPDREPFEPMAPGHDGDHVDRADGKGQISDLLRQIGVPDRSPADEPDGGRQRDEQHGGPHCVGRVVVLGEDAGHHQCPGGHQAADLADEDQKLQGDVLATGPGPQADEEGGQHGADGDHVESKKMEPRG